VTFAWTDPQLLGVTAKRVHLEELRLALRQAYDAAAVAMPFFVDDPLTPGITVIRTAHIQQLRDAVLMLEAVEER